MNDKPKFDITNLMINDIILFHDYPVQVEELTSDDTVGFKYGGVFTNEPVDGDLDAIRIEGALLCNSLFDYVEDELGGFYRRKDTRQIDGGSYTLYADMIWNQAFEWWDLNIYNPDIEENHVMVPELKASVRYLHQLQHMMKVYELDTIWDIPIDEEV